MLGSVFAALKGAHPDFTYTALVRNPSHFDAVRAVGATPVLGSVTDHDTITYLAEAADIVVNCADSSSDDIGFIHAILKGMKKRKDGGKSVGILIQTSGTAVFVDGTKEGKWVEGGKIWNVSILQASGGGGINDNALTGWKCPRHHGNHC